MQVAGLAQQGNMFNLQAANAWNQANFGYGELAAKNRQIDMQQNAMNQGYNQQNSMARGYNAYNQSRGGANYSNIGSGLMAGANGSLWSSGTNTLS